MASIKFPLFSIFAAIFAAAALYYQYVVGQTNALAGGMFSVFFVIALLRREIL